VKVILTTITGFAYIGDVNLQPGEDHTGDPIETPYVTVLGIKCELPSSVASLMATYKESAVEHHSWLVPWQNIADMMSIPEET